MSGAPVSGAPRPGRHAAGGVAPWFAFVGDREAEVVPPRPRGATRVLPPEDPARDPRRPVRVARGVSAVLVVLCLLGTLQAAAMIAIEARRWWTAEREVARLEREVAELRREAADLAEIASRGGDERFREHLARRQGYVYPHEVRYVIVPLQELPAGAP